MFFIAVEDYRKLYIKSSYQVILLLMVLLNFDNYNFMLAIIIFIVGYVLYHSMDGKIGGADIKVISILTIYYGFDIFNITGLSSIFAILYIIIFRKTKEKIPFFPFLLLGVVCVTF